MLLEGAGPLGQFFRGIFSLLSPVKGVAEGADQFFDDLNTQKSLDDIRDYAKSHPDATEEELIDEYKKQNPYQAPFIDKAKQLQDAGFLDLFKR